MQGFLDQYGPLVGLIGLGLSVVATALAIWLALRIRSYDRRLRDLFKGASGASIEESLAKQIRVTEQFGTRLEKAEARLDGAENVIATAKRFVGLVRYDAFEDVGGSQSFALALYDDNGDGAVVTSMVGRTDCRVYAKEIRRGKSERELSSEEQAAIEAAVKPRSAPTEAKAGR
jgi:hypothetical protein